MYTLILATLGAFASAPGAFLLPSEILEADGVRLTAQVPQPGLKLIEKDESRPKLWYAPVASSAVDGGVRIWYQRVNSGEEAWIDQRTLCVVNIRDGEWTIPALHPEPPAWGGTNNICLTRSPHKPTWGGFNVFQLVEHDGRLQLLYWDQPSEDGLAGAMLAVSEDGLAWEKRPGSVFTEHNDAYSLMKLGSEFWLYQTMLEDWPEKPITDNIPAKRRVQAFRKSSDLTTWTDQKVILRPDEQDPPEAEFYLMKTFPYGGGFAGLLMKYYADPKLEGKHSGIIVNELITSRDGMQWQRPFRETDIGFWSYADPFEMEGQTHFAIWKDGGMETVTYREGRLAGLIAEETGHFLIALDPDEGLPKSVNADTRNGSLELTVVDGGGNTQDTYGQCRVEGVDDTRISLEWRRDDLSPGLRLRVVLTKGMIFGIK